MVQRTRIPVIVGGLAAIAAALMAAWPLLAATKSASGARKSKEAYFRCKDASGQTYYGQSIPSECMDFDVEVLDHSGHVVRVIEGRKTLVEHQQQQAEADAQKKAQEAAGQRDRTLLATYLTVADIERLRDQRLGQLQAQAHVTSQYIVNLKERESRLISDAAKYKPYASSPNAPPVPDHVAEEMVNTINGLKVYQEELAKSTNDQVRLRDEFESDIARFKQLKGIN